LFLRLDDDTRSGRCMFAPELNDDISLLAVLDQARCVTGMDGNIAGCPTCRFDLFEDGVFKVITMPC
jgi:hypothetical protein